jgi:hypothetical protein
MFVQVSGGVDCDTGRGIQRGAHGGASVSGVVGNTAAGNQDGGALRTTRIRLLKKSAMNRLPVASTATPAG